jgi:molybdopterin-guanine dinucleotide biosynthesis protein A
MLRERKTETAAAAPRVEAAGFVLAGGQSRRMGRDKALVEFAGKPLVARAVELLRACGLTVEIAGARSALGRFAPVVHDERPDRGPLEGICRALRQIKVEWGVFLPVDLPLAPRALIEFLLKRARVTERLVTLARVNGVAQTFPVVIRRGAGVLLEAELESGSAGCMAAFEAAARKSGEEVDRPALELLVQAGLIVDERGLAPARWFVNVNTEEELARAERLIA